jgi:hypothetical protein
MEDAALLYVSDCPETFKGHGILFRAPLPQDSRISRLLFDHVNGTGVPMRVLVGIVNAGNAAGSVTTVGGTGGPDPNFILVGHAATLRFIQMRESGASTGNAIAANGTIMLADVALPPGACAAGIFDIAGDGKGYTVVVAACDPSSDSAAVFGTLPPALDDGKSRRGVFDITGSAEAKPVAYSGSAVAIEFGTETFPRIYFDPYEGPDHKGEYAVLRRFTCSLSGNGSICLYQSARAGISTATYVVDGKVLASHAIPAGPRSKIATFVLSPGQSQQVTLETMAEANSSYPFQLSFDVDDPQLADAGTGNSPVYQA